MTMMFNGTRKKLRSFDNSKSMAFYVIDSHRGRRRQDFDFKVMLGRKAHRSFVTTDRSNLTRHFLASLFNVAILLLDNYFVFLNR